MKSERIYFSLSFLLATLFSINILGIHAQEVEVQGTLKITQMNANNDQDNLVIQNSDGTLGTRSVASLPPPPPPIDSTRNLASDFELAKHLCDCPNLPPFMIKKLLDSGYSEEELVSSGISYQDVLDAQRGGIMIDPRDNKSYKTVTIGSQTWMAENLNFGLKINSTTDQTDNAIIEKYCYDNDNANCDTYGGLYQWHEAMSYTTTISAQGICPNGWHIPSDSEWMTLEIELGMSVAETQMIHLRGSNQGSQIAGNEGLWTDNLLDQNGFFGSSGLTVLPGGYTYYFNGSFQGQLSYSAIWTSRDFGTDEAWYRHIAYNSSKLDRFHLDKSNGYSIRCIQD